MCGRFTQAHSWDEVARFYRLGADPGWRPRYNVAPGQMVACVRIAAGGREALLMRWGLVPSWAQDEKALKMKPINARAETASQKPMFRGPFRQRRCIVPVSGWYEWRREGGATASAAKHPYHFCRRDGGLFALAGLWERFEGPGGALETFAVLTVAASDLARPVHDRMPAILEGEAAEAWWRIRV